MLDFPDIFEDSPASAAPVGVAEMAPQYGVRPDPFYYDPEHGIRLYQGDALDLLARMKPAQFDLSRKYEESTSSPLAGRL